MLNLIGQEFPAVFLSTTEPIDQDGNTLNPTKSPCDRYVFNTVLTRAKSLVVVVGSPRVLLNTEQHMVKLYGDKGRCWSLYLKICLEHGTLKIPQSVEPNQRIAQRFIKELATQLGATLPNDQNLLRSSRLNYRTCPRNTSLVTTSSANSSVSGTHSARSSSSHYVKSGIRLVHKPLSSDENVCKQNLMSPVEDMAPKNVHTPTPTYSHPAVQGSQRGSIQISRPLSVEGVNQPLNVKSAAIQTMQESGIDSSVSTTSSTAVHAIFSQPIKWESSTQLSETPFRQSMKCNPKSESRGK